MKIPIVREEDVQETVLPGRHLRWLITPDSAGAQHLSMCCIRVAPGETVRPAHSHPNGEEAIYVIRGTGRVLVDGAVEHVKEGTAVLFPQGSVHMLQNTGTEDMKVVCAFAPPSNLGTYKLSHDVEFPS